MQTTMRGRGVLSTTTAVLVFLFCAASASAGVARRASLPPVVRAALAATQDAGPLRVAPVPGIAYRKIEAPVGGSAVSNAYGIVGDLNWGFEVRGTPTLVMSDAGFYLARDATSARAEARRAMNSLIYSCHGPLQRLALGPLGSAGLAGACKGPLGMWDTEATANYGDLTLIADSVVGNRATAVALLRALLAAVRLKVAQTPAFARAALG
jgi:hypothetical protein